MKIYACLLTEAPNLWHFEICDSLTKMGHDVSMPSAIGMNECWEMAEQGQWTPGHRGQMSQRLFNDVRTVYRRTGLDLFLAYVFPFQFDAKVFKKIEDLGIPTVFLNCDNLVDDYPARALSGSFTLSWVPEKEAVRIYEKMKRRYLYLPLAANPELDKPLGLKETRQIVCVATKTPYRCRLLGSLLKKNYPLEVYGNNWRPGKENNHYALEMPRRDISFDRATWVDRCRRFMEDKKKSLETMVHYGLRPKRMWKRIQKWTIEYEGLFKNRSWGHPVTPQRMVELFSEARVTLGINHYIDPGYQHLEGLTFSKLRDFQALMSGACYLTEATPELHDFYPEGDCLMTYRGLDELCEKADWLLKNQTQRDAMRQKARRYSLERHTWAHRFRVLFDHLGLREHRHNRVEAGAKIAGSST